MKNQAKATWQNGATKVTTVLLIRHATTDLIGERIAGSMPGVHLNAQGQAQAVVLSEALRDWPIAAIYSSPLERARETAAPLSERAGLPIQFREAFGELHFGAWEGRSLQELAGDSLWQRFNACRSLARAPGGELMMETAARVVTELEHLRAQHNEDCLAIFSHGDVIRAALILYAGIPFDLFQRIEISPASISIVELHDSGPCLKGVNWPVAHLPPQPLH